MLTPGLRSNAGMAIDEKEMGKSLEQQNKKPYPLSSLCREGK